MTQTKLSGRQKLELSRLHLTQQELMGDDVDIHHVKLQIKNAFRVEITDAITDAEVERTVEGASTLSITVLDRDRKLLRSGRLAKNTDVKIDGLWFRLVAIDKNDDQLTLTFEDREIAVLRSYASIIKATPKTSRHNVTRAQFVLRLIKEVKEFKIPWVIPELERIQPIEEDKQGSQPLGGNDANAHRRGKGIPHGAGNDITPDRARMHQYAGRFVPGLRVKSQRMSNTQIDVANAVLDTGTSMNCTRPQLVMSMMCCIQESTLRNLKGGDRDSVGVFQQRRSQGWPATRNVARDARAFFTALKTIDARHPNWTYAQKVQGVQNSAYPDAYSDWRAESERIVEAYGVAENFTSSNSMQTGITPQDDYEFYRGVPPSGGLSKWGRENSWTCITRLADEVNWRSFFVSGTFYYISEEDLMQSKPAAIIREGNKGVQSINGQYDTGKKNSELTVEVRMGRWSAPPGSVILLRDMGPWNGRWLVTNIKRSLFSSLGTITLKKPRPAWPEPIGDTSAQNNAKQEQVSYSFNAAAPLPVVGGDGGSAQSAAKKLLAYHAQGKYRDDNGRQISQLKKIANGEKLRNQCGHMVHMNAFVLNALVQLIEGGVWVGTFALCEDHRCNNGQHPLGQAADISSLGSMVTGWKSLNTPSAAGTGLAKQAMKILGPTAWDLICNGVGRYDSTVQALQRDNGHIKGGVWESNHTNHIHYGVAPGRRD